MIRLKLANLCLVCLFLQIGSLLAADEGKDVINHLSRYHVKWETPGKNSTASMPVGNGDLGANVYTVENGDLFLLLGKTDAFDWNGNLYKTGRIRVKINPNPFPKGKPFSQILNITQGCIDIKGNNDVFIRIWVDANYPAYHIDIEGPRHFDIQVKPEFWERFDGSFDKVAEENNQILWYYTNGERSCYKDDLKYYDISEMSEKHPDPFLYNTFGCLMSAPQMTLKEKAFTGYGKSFHITVFSQTKQGESEEWKDVIKKTADSYNATQAWEKHCNWWSNFWDRSWITASDNTIPEAEREKETLPEEPGVRSEKDGGFIVAQSYNVHRYMMASQSRGRYQVPFSGGIFTMPIPNYRMKDGSWYKEDERDWTNRFTFQNQRLLYWPMLAAGDFEEMKPFFNYYYSILDLRKAITKQWFGHDGAYFRENVQLTGAEIDDSPFLPNKPPKTTKSGSLPPAWYHNYHFNSGLEMTTMGLEYYFHTLDDGFLTDTVIPLAREVLRFYAKHYDKDKKGTLHMYPSQVLETWWSATNPTPDVAGLRYVLQRLLKIEGLSKSDRAEWTALYKSVPSVPIGEETGKRFIRPAEKFDHFGNCENGELYATFPYPLFGVGNNTEDIVAETMLRRTAKNAIEGRCWTQDQIDYARAGMAKEAKDGLINRWRHYSKNLRLPMFGTEAPDYVPDFDHNGSGSVALQKMLVQEIEGKIYLLPAWPKEWDGSFKLHLTHHTIIEGSIKNGVLERFSITPKEREKDVVLSNNK